MSRVKEFYRDKTIFVTGGLGLLGKVAIEKLLYSCSDVKKVYMLIRVRDDQNIYRRLNEMLDSQAFDRIRSEKPEVLKKLIPICGDIKKENFGLSNEDFKLITKETDLIFNIAASVDFVATILNAFETNTLSFIHLVKIAKQMKKLQLLLHVSTTFCFRDREFIDEVYYKPKDDCQWVFDDLENYEKYLILAEKKSLHGHPSVYSYTKRLTEMVAMKEYNNLPICLLRPSIVTPSISEPIPGWVDSYFNPATDVAGVAKGMIRSTYVRSDIILNFIPVDSVSRAMLTMVWDLLAVKKKMPDEIPIMNVSFPESIASKLTFTEFQNHLTACIQEAPLACAIWVPNVVCIRSNFYTSFHRFLFQLLPAFLLDAIFKVINRKSDYVKQQREYFKFHDSCKTYKDLVDQTLPIKTLEDLNERILSDEDVNDFAAFPKNLEIQNYTKIFYKGVRKFVVKESDNDIPVAKVKLVTFFLLDVILKFLFFGFLLVFVLRMFNFSLF